MAHATATPLPVHATPSLVPTPASTPTVAVRVPAAAPSIASVEFTPSIVHSGDTVVGHVTTSSNVASVEVRFAGYGKTMTKIAPGRFVLSYTVGDVPFFLHRTYSIEIIARNTHGDAVSETLPLTIR